VAVASGASPHHQSIRVALSGPKTKHTNPHADSESQQVRGERDQAAARVQISVQRVDYKNGEYLLASLRLHIARSRLLQPKCMLYKPVYFTPVSPINTILPSHSRLSHHD
jgi:hypothetical protein